MSYASTHDRDARQGRAPCGGLDSAPTTYAAVGIARAEPAVAPAASETRPRKLCGARSSYRALFLLVRCGGLGSGRRTAGGGQSRVAEEERTHLCACGRRLGRGRERERPHTFEVGDEATLQTAQETLDVLVGRVVFVLLMLADAHAGRRGRPRVEPFARVQVRRAHDEGVDDEQKQRPARARQIARGLRTVSAEAQRQLENSSGRSQ